MVVRAEELPGQVSSTGSWYNETVSFQKIPTDGLVYWGEDYSYDSCCVLLDPDSNLPNIVGDWFYYTTVSDDNNTCQLRKHSISTGEDVVLDEFSMGQAISCLSDDLGHLIYYFNDVTAETQDIYIMDTDSGEITTTLSLDLQKLLGIHNGMLYYQADHPDSSALGSSFQRIPLTDGDPELICAASNVMTDGDAINFTDDAIYTQSADLLYRIPLDDLGQDDYPYTNLHLCTDPTQEKPSAHTDAAALPSRSMASWPALGSWKALT